jgi:nicotinic acid mononucleotide adenylyltransferase
VLVSPGHPLKAEASPYARRFAACQEMFRHPQLIVSDLEKQMGVFGTANFVEELRTRFPDTEFVFIGGMDLPRDFHKWQRWQWLLRAMPFAFFARPPYERMVGANVLNKQNRLTLKQVHLHAPLSRGMKLMSSHIYWIKSSHRLAVSSTQRRAQNP